MNIPTQIKPIGDVTSITLIFGAWVEALPHVAAFLSIVWVAIRIFETRSVQKMFGRKSRTRSDDVGKENL